MKFIHEYDLGKKLDAEEIARQLAEPNNKPCINAVLQYLRTHMSALERYGRQPPPGSPADYRAYHDGAADGVEEAFWFIARENAENA